MGTSLTPEFWERFTLLLFAAMGVTFALAALFDALALRRQVRRARRTPGTPARTPQGPATTVHRTSVHC
ncbi:hypothetical protein AB0I00_20900 [Streptomyces sp. NPDC050803]|uniref:hypothetical protein n=1 Tax=unclassified Streptomyces TaxID=2593676 RepID=UPI0034473B2C